MGKFKSAPRPSRSGQAKSRWVSPRVGFVGSGTELAAVPWSSKGLEFPCNCALQGCWRVVD
eukprot:5290005-Heterocapsa_arctica.AAC.1